MVVRRIRLAATGFTVSGLGIVALHLLMTR